MSLNETYMKEMGLKFDNSPKNLHNISKNKLLNQKK